MHETAGLAGFFAAHAVWMVSEAEGLDPLLAFETADGQREMERFVGDDAVQRGQDAVEANRPGAARAVLIIDAYLGLGSGRLDALIIYAVQYGPARQSIKMAVPYRPRTHPQGFAVYRPKFTNVICDREPDYEMLATAFYDGVGLHQPAAAVWNAHLDETR